jgi:hypothetical protein
LRELVGAQQFEDCFDFVQEHDLFARATPRPAFEESIQDGSGRIGILFDVLDNAVGELLMVESDAFGFYEEESELAPGIANVPS